MATRPAVWFAFLLAAASAVAIGLLAIAPDQSRIASRLADPFGDHPWPPDTAHDAVRAGMAARGEPFILRGELTGVVPDRAEFRFAIEGSPPTVQALAVTRGDNDGSFGLRWKPIEFRGTFAIRFRPAMRRPRGERSQFSRRRNWSIVTANCRLRPACRFRLIPIFNQSTCRQDAAVSRA